MIKNGGDINVETQAKKDRKETWEANEFRKWLLVGIVIAILLGTGFMMAICGTGDERFGIVPLFFLSVFILIGFATGDGRNTPR